MMMANNNFSEVKAAAGVAAAGAAPPPPGDGSAGDDSGGGDSAGGGGGGEGDSSEVNIRRGLDVIQSMIDISADRLEGLRTQCATSAELTQQEIRTLETKLVKLFSDLLITKSKLPERLPARGLPATGNELKQWLRVVGLSCASLNAVIQQVTTLEGLLEKDERELRTIMGNNVYVREEEIKRLTRACSNLRRCREHLELPVSDGGGRKGTEPHDLFWDSWDRQPACHRTSPRVNRSLGGKATAKHAAATGGYHNQRHHNNGPTESTPATTTANTSPQTEDGSMMQHEGGLLNPQHAISPDEASTSGCTPSPSPPNSPSSVLLHNKQNRRGFPTTPPPRKKHQTALLSYASSSSCSPVTAASSTVSTVASGTNNTTSTTSSGSCSAAEAASTALTKSKSHESQFGSQQAGGGGGSGTGGITSGTNNNNSHANNNNNNNSINHINNNIPSTVVVSLSEGVSLTNTTSATSNGGSGGSGGTFVSQQQQRLMGNGSANRMGTFPRSRLHTEPTITGSGGGGVVGGGGGGSVLSTSGDHHQHHHHQPSQQHYHHHYHHHLQQQQQGVAGCTGMSPEAGGEYGGTGDPGVPPHPTGGVGIISSSSAVPPKSPCTPIITRGMGHMIQHRFTKKFKVTKSTCDLCLKQMFFGFKCTECKYRCHKDCKSNVPPSCGLPQEFVDEFKKSLQSDTLLPTSVSPNIGRSGGGSGGVGAMYGGGRSDGGKAGMVRGPMHAIHACGGGPDSSSAGSSCNSSSPSSPALLSLPPQTPATSKYSQFNFPEVPSGGGGVHGGGTGGSSGSTTTMMMMAMSGGSDRSGGGITIETHPIGGGGTGGLGGSLGSSGVYTMDTSVEIPKLQFSDIPDHNVPGGGEDKTGSASATSTDSSSDRTPIRLDSTEERDHESSWPRQNSLSLKEWDIPYDDLHLKEKIGNGRFGTVHRALWHGDVAVKLLKEDYVADERTLEAFKLEVATFKKTRHENVVLFMGACMKPPRLAIVTSLCKGNTLFTHIHLRKDKFNLNRTTLVAQQISQGMGYLHARGIVHKDLKTKNIFLENGKVIITDFGLFSATKLLYCELGLGIPGGWLCYLAPELMRNLTPYRPVEGDLPFSKASDIYAFGTVWYELLCGEFPFKSQPAESIIWQVGRGMKQTLANLQASRDVKDILIQCWSYHSDDRPDFAKLLTQLERLPKKRLARSPSHPVQLSRSAESVF
ncbi:kinase suppressor of Ras 1 [Anopheles maculipalpis]|uniref:kinase suppressor of Ras 1 n=1 Tax=Anopheles maculipalpis TaxID=1496333 RepID=UPI00215955D4|nr:kinase suppressor of Ras 1 [Anopheles maculipalpis]